MVNDDLKCIFLHPNKCGGKSVATAIWRIDTKVGSADHTLPDTHIQRFGRETWDSYWKFGFTRNPWDRLVSIYTGSIQIMQQNGLGEFGHFVRNTVSGNPRDKYDVVLQSDYFNFEDKPIDFIGRFEHYEEDWKVVHDEKPEGKAVTRILQKGPSRNRVQFEDGTQGFVEKNDLTIRYL